MKSIETLSRVDVLCVDKTGTITEPGMQVSHILWRRQIMEKDVDELQENGMATWTKVQLQEKLADYVMASVDHNATMDALQDAVKKMSSISAQRKNHSMWNLFHQHTNMAVCNLMTVCIF